MSTRKKLAQTAKRLAELPFHGRTEEQESNLLPIVRLFPKWDLERAERMWCAAFGICILLLCAGGFSDSVQSKRVQNVQSCGLRRLGGICAERQSN